MYATIDKEIEEHFLQFEEIDEEKKEFVAKELRLQKIGKNFLENEAWRQELQGLCRSRVLKMPKIL